MKVKKSSAWLCCHLQFSDPLQTSEGKPLKPLQTLHLTKLQDGGHIADWADCRVRTQDRVQGTGAGPGWRTGFRVLEQGLGGGQGSGYWNRAWVEDRVQSTGTGPGWRTDLWLGPLNLGPLKQGRH